MPLVGQKPAFPFQPTGKAAEAPVGRHDTVTRDEHRDRVGATGPAHSPHGPGPADRGRDLRIGARLTPRDGGQRRPNLSLERRAAAQVQRHPAAARSPRQGRAQGALGCATPVLRRSCQSGASRSPPGAGPLGWKIQSRQASFREGSAEQTQGCLEIGGLHETIMRRAKWERNPRDGFSRITSFKHGSGTNNAFNLHGS